MATDAFGLSDTSPEEILFGKEEEQESPEAQDEALTEQPAEAAPEEPTEPQAQERPRDEHGRFVKLEEGEQAPPGTEEVLIEVPDEIEGEEVDIPASEEEQPRLWAGKYTAPEELERGYNESREQWRRAVEARKAEQQRAYEAELREAELARVIQESLPYLNRAAEREKQYHQFAEQYKSQMGQYPEGYTGPPKPEEQRALAPDQVTAIVEQRLQQERQQMQAEMAARQEYEATASAIMGFYRDHPEVEPRSPADNQITDTLQALNEAWAMYDEEVDMTDRGTIEVLYEASQRPALQSVLALKPAYFDSEAGLKLARMEAAVIEGAPGPTQQTQSVPASQVGRSSGQRKPFQESAVTGAEVLEDENDEWSQIKRAYRKGQDTQSIFSFE